MTSRWKRFSARLEYVMTTFQTFTAFEGARQIATGDLETVARALAASPDSQSVLIFTDQTGQRVELDLSRGPDAALAEYRARTAPPNPPRQRGRPKLGVVAREVTLLPRHWEWLAGQPGGASAVLRRLIEDARRNTPGAGDARRAQEAVYRVMSAMAGDLPGFEDASRALFARDDSTFDGLIATWPADVVAYLTRLATAERQARADA